MSIEAQRRRLRSRTWPPSAVAGPESCRVRPSLRRGSRGAILARPSPSGRFSARRHDAVRRSRSSDTPGAPCRCFLGYCGYALDGECSHVTQASRESQLPGRTEAARRPVLLNRPASHRWGCLAGKFISRHPSGLVQCGLAAKDLRKPGSPCRSRWSAQRLFPFSPDLPEAPSGLQAKVGKGLPGCSWMGSRRTHTLLLLLGFTLAFAGPAASFLAAPCPACHGTGQCPTCGGLGYISAGMIHGQPAAYGCDGCGGFRGNPVSGPPGRPGDGRCQFCHGTGQVPGEPFPLPRRAPDPARRPRNLPRQKAHAEANRLNAVGVGHFKRPAMARGDRRVPGRLGEMAGQQDDAGESAKRPEG